MSLKMYLSMYYAVLNKHDALIIDQTSDHVFKLNWDTALILN